MHKNWLEHYVNTKINKKKGEEASTKFSIFFYGWTDGGDNIKKKWKMEIKNDLGKFRKIGVSYRMDL